AAIGLLSPFSSEIYAELRDNEPATPSGMHLDQDVEKRFDHAQREINAHAFAEKNKIADIFYRALTDKGVQQEAGGKPLLLLPTQKYWRVQCYEDSNLIEAWVFNPGRQQENQEVKLGFYSLDLLEKTIGPRSYMVLPMKSLKQDPAN